MRFALQTQGMKDTLMRFPVTIIFSVLATILSIALNHADYSATMTGYDVTIHTSVVGMFLATLGTVVYERFYAEKQATIKWGIQIAAGVLTAIYGVIALNVYDYFTSDLYFRTGIALLFLTICIIWLPTIKNDILTFSKNFRIWFKSFFMVFLYVAVLILGLQLILLAWSTLIATVDGALHADVFAICLGLAFPFLLLSQQSPYTVPYQAEEGKMTADTSKMLDVLLTKILVPLISVLTVVIFIYLAMQLNNLMDITIEYIMVTYLAFAWIILLLVKDIDRPRLRFYTWGQCGAILLASALQIYRSVSYSMMFGVTHDRYFLILFCGVSIIAAVLYHRWISWLPVAVATALLVSFVPPVDALTVSVQSQKNIFDNLITQNPNLIQNRIFQLNEENVSGLSETDKVRLRQSLEYLDRRNELDAFAEIPSDFDVYEDLRPLNNVNVDGSDSGGQEEAIYHLYAYYDDADGNEGMPVQLDGQGEVVMLSLSKDASEFTSFGRQFTGQIVDNTQLTITDTENDDQLVFDLQSFVDQGDSEEGGTFQLSGEEAVFESESDTLQGSVLIQEYSLTEDYLEEEYNGTATFILILSEK